MRTIKEVANDYAYGFITFTELVERMSICCEEDGFIIRDELAKVKQTEEFSALWREFQGRLGELYEDNDVIYDIARYHIRKARQSSEPNEED